MQHPESSPEHICRLLTSYRFCAHTELLLQDGIEEAFRREHLSFEREVILSPKDRPDFMVNGVAVEVKIQGSLSQALRQVSRYLGHAQVRAAVLVGTPAWLRQVPAALCGKPVFSVRLLASSF